MDNSLGLLGSVILGMLAGLFANKIMDKNSDGCWWNLFLGVIGGFVGGWVFDLLHIHWGGLIGQLGTAIVGAVIVLWIAAKLKR